jgi:acetyl-CoA carboxylase biotin carboxyl carrier protein
MDLEQLKLILDLFRAHDLSEFEIEQEGLRLKIRKDAQGMPAVVMHPPAPAYGAPAAVASPPPAASGAAARASDGPSPTAAEANDAVDADVELAVVKSPIVGTFYRSPEPGAPPFVDVGVAVKKGQVLCVIEAMKLMNEIDSEYDGEIVNVYVESGQPVQYGERLFAIKTK